MEMDFMGLSGNTSTQMERDGNREYPEDDSDKNLSLSLFQEAQTANSRIGHLQRSSSLSSGKSNSSVTEEGDQVALNLGSCINNSAIRGTVVKVGNVSGSAGKLCLSAFNCEKQRTLLRFPSASKEEVHYGIESPHLNDKTKAQTATLLAAGKLPNGLAELDIQPQQHSTYFKDNVPVSNMSMQWLQWTKAAALQHHMTLKNVQEEKPVKRKTDWLVSSSVQPVPTVDAFKSSKRCSISSQKSFTFSPPSNDSAESRGFYSVANGNPNRHFGASPTNLLARASQDQSSLDYPLEQAGDFLRAKSLSPPSNFKEYLASPFKEQQTADNSCGAHLSSGPSPNQTSVWCGASPSSVATMQVRAASNVPGKQGSAQLTIFYGGTVNVYEDIPPEKAHTIMLLAGNVSSTSGKATDSSPQRFTMSTPLATDGHSRPTTPNICSSLPNALTSMSPKGASQMCNGCVPQVHTQKSQISSQPGQSTRSSPGDGEFQTNLRDGAANGHQEPAKQSVSGSNPTVVRRALPQARKASLTRFLERRKERIVPNAPSATKESPDPDHLSSQIEKSFNSTSCFDGCPSPQQYLTSDVLDVKILSKPQSMEQLWLQKAKTKAEDLKPGHELASC
uniref:TSA: Wollemia nobilis Ref_Wollemi_Transcript_7673_3021 transcribed RNA sequence n=1 Tax=Wollemia nobilis TaxID=56998 RepID=A0A0C9RWZ9_9CONI